MSAGTCCRRPAVTAERTETLRSAAQRMEQQQLGALVVVEDGRPLAVLTDRDVALQVLALGRDPSAPLAESVGDTPLVAVSEDATLAEACAAMRSDGVRRLPVIGHEGRIVGMLTSDDIVRLAAEDLTALADVAAEQSPRRGRAPGTDAARGALHYARPVVAVGEQTPVRDVAARMREADVGCVVVLDGGEAPCGLVTDRDLAVRGLPAVRRSEGWRR